MFFALALAVSVTAQATSQPWSFVESVGGLRVDLPVLKSGHWYLPVLADVSGLHDFGAKPTAMNSGLACSGVEARVVPPNVYLTLRTGIAGFKASSRCPDAQLGVPPRGRYQVLYRSPDGKTNRIGEIEIGL